MGRKPARRFTAEEKLRILEEARQPQTTVAEVRRILAGVARARGSRAATRPCGSSSPRSSTPPAAPSTSPTRC
jgi:transposase-like protein